MRNAPTTKPSRFTTVMMYMLSSASARDAACAMILSISTAVSGAGVVHIGTNTTSAEPSHAQSVRSRARMHRSTPPK